MKRLPFFLLLGSMLVSSSAAWAEPGDPAAARELLKRGFALRKAGNFSEALTRLNESFRLDRQIKTLINIADCEEQLGSLTSALEHWIAARDQAVAEENSALLAESNKRLQALETRMPRLTLKPPVPPPEGFSVRRDGILLMSASLGIPLPTDPGTHEILVTAPGFANRTFSVDLHEKDEKTLSLAVGDAISPAPLEEPKLPGPLAARSPVKHELDDGGWPMQRKLSVGALALGVVSFGASAVTWTQAVRQNNHARDACSPACSSEAHALRDNAEANANRTTGLLIVGGAFVVAGGILFATSPKRRAESGVSLTPNIRASYAGIALDGTF